MPTTIKTHIRSLLKIVSQLQKLYPQKRFTLDGRLVGDIGEVLAEEKYNIRLNNGLTKHDDAMCMDGTQRKLQIKSTMKDSLTYPVDHIPDYYLGIKIHEDGTIEEIFNGPGKVIKQKIKHYKSTRAMLYSIPNSILKKLNETVPGDQRIPKRKK
jgi:Family of unknown function (DUF6998)